MEVNLPDTAAFRFTSSVLSIDPLTDDIIRLRIERPRGYDYHGGQFLTLFNPEGVGRSYSLASLPVLDPFLELHIRLVPKGQVSGWVHDSLKVGDTVTISEASGNCFYTADNKQQALLLVGTGSGLAPLYGILRDAIHHGHQGDIKLYHGSGTMSGIYLNQELNQLAENHHNFSYFPCVSRELPPAGVTSGRATAIALEQNPQLTGWRAYICGEPKMVNDTSRAIFMAGVSLQEVYSDPFVHSNPR